MRMTIAFLALLLSTAAEGSTCGNSIIEAGEQCDDGNQIEGDGCSTLCVFVGCPLTGTWLSNYNLVWTLVEDAAGGITGNVHPLGPSTSVYTVVGRRSDTVVSMLLVEHNIDIVGTASNCNDVETSFMGISMTRVRSTYCGDGIVHDPTEVCDDGNLQSGDDCTAVCTPAACGNGIVEGSEQCDDSNSRNGDGCSTSCESNVCGNHIIEPGEHCDDGNQVNGDGCSSLCETNMCGNGVIEPGEECDDSNRVSGDTCSGLCAFEGCSLTGTWVDFRDSSWKWSLVEDNAGAITGILSVGQVAHATAVTGRRVGTDVSLSLPDVGFSATSRMFACDEIALGGNPWFDLARIRATYCGDGILQSSLEACDDGNFENGDDCTVACTAPSGCGNGAIDPGEECDDANGDNKDACLTTCERNACGDGFVHIGEETCDDGNALSGDGCDCITTDPESAYASVGGAFLVVSTDSEGDGAVPSDPIETTLIAPSQTISGAFAINEGPVPPTSMPGFVFVGTLVRATAQNLVPAPTPATPLTLMFQIDASLIALGQDQTTIHLRKDGVPVDGCTGDPAVADPDPCISTRERLGDGDVRLTILTSALSDWDFQTSICGSSPLLGCQPPSPRSAVLKLREHETRDTAFWKWRSSRDTPASLFGDPQSRNDLALCIYDPAGLAMQISVPAGALCAGRGCWASTATGFRYADRSRSHGGISRVTLREGSTGKARIAFAAKGDLLLPHIPAATPLYVQLRSRDGACFEARFSSPGANQGGVFKSKSD